MHTLTQSQFQAAFQHGAVQSVEIEPQGAQFAVRFLTLTGDAMLVQARNNEPRLFGTVDGALKVLHKLGVRRIVLGRLEHWPMTNGNASGPPSWPSSKPCRRHELRRVSHHSPA